MEKILVAINDDLLKEIYKGLFQEKDFYVLEANDENEVFSIISKEFPDIVLLDVDFAEKNDFDLLKRIGNEDSTKKIPIVFFSKVKENEHNEAVINFGVKDFILASKYSPIEVLNRIKVHLSVEKTYKISVDSQTEVIKNLAKDLECDDLLCKKCLKPLKLYLIRDLSKGSNYFKVSFVCTDC